MVVGFHGINEPRLVNTLVKLKKSFVLAHVHFKNFTYQEDARPFPAFAYEVLLVNQALAEVDTRLTRPALHCLLDSLNNPKPADCQADW